jgi:hypothetical protein
VYTQQWHHLRHRQKQQQMAAEYFSGGNIIYIEVRKCICITGILSRKNAGLPNL